MQENSEFLDVQNDDSGYGELSMSIHTSNAKHPQRRPFIDVTNTQKQDSTDKIGLKNKVKFKNLRKRRTLNQIQKKHIIELKDSGVSHNLIRDMTGTPRTTINYILKNRRTIEKQFELKKNVEQIKTVREVTHPKLEEVLFMWFLNQRQKGIPVSQTIMRLKAEVFHKDLCEKEKCQFKASTGYIQKFRTRHKIRILSVSGERLSANYSGIEEFLDDVMTIYKENNFTLHHLLNADETGCFWKQVPSKSMVLSEEKNAPGKKQNKDRITITACSNLTGTLKPVLQIIGKSKKPRCFDGKVLPPMFYDYNSKAWQTRDTFKRYFYEVLLPAIRAFCEENDLVKGAILILDNATSHSLYDDFSNDDNVYVRFLPANCTSVYQPMDQSTLQPLKSQYRKKLMEYVSDIEDWITAIKKLSLLQAVKWLTEAWNDLSPSVIINSWKNLLEGMPEYDVLRENNEFNDKFESYPEIEQEEALDELTIDDIMHIMNDQREDVPDDPNEDYDMIINDEPRNDVQVLEEIIINETESSSFKRSFDDLIKFYTLIHDNNMQNMLMNEKNKYFP